MPLIVAGPGLPGDRTIGGVVSLTDIHATILRFAGLGAGEGADSVALPGLGLDGDATRAHVFGATAAGVMVTDDEWKLARYRNGVTTLFNLGRPPGAAQPGLSGRARREVLRRLDGLLQGEVLRSIVAGHGDKVVVTHDQDPAFSLPGFRRVYPHPG